MKKEEVKKQQTELSKVLRKQNVPETKRKLILKEVKDKAEKERTMKLSIKEGGFASLMSGLGDSYIIPYALTLNSNNFQIGLLKAFSSLLPPISQIFGTKLMEKDSRKKIIVTYVALSAFMWLPILFLSLFFWKSIFTQHLPYFLIFFYTLYAVLGAIAGPAWFSLMGDLVPDNIRGKYFGKRNRLTETVALISSLSAAFLLDYYKTKGLALLGFSILFFTASIARFISAYYFTKHYEPKFKIKKNYYFSFLQFVLGVKKYNFTKFAFYIGIMNLAVMIASPFFTVYMLQELKFSYVVFMVVSLSQTLLSILFMPIWGKFSDKYGRKETLLISSILISIMPFLWFFSKSPYFLIFPMMLSGIGWSGFSLASFNFIYDSVSIERRGLCVSYYNILGGIGMFIGGIFGGYILQILPSVIFGMSEFVIIFFISGFLRALTTIIFLPKVKEIRNVRKFNPIIVFRHMRNTPGIIHEIYATEQNIEKDIEKAFPD